MIIEFKKIWLPTRLNAIILEGRMTGDVYIYPPGVFNFVEIDTGPKLESPATRLCPRVYFHYRTKDDVKIKTEYELFIELDHLEKMRYELPRFLRKNGYVKIRTPGYYDAFINIREVMEITPPPERSFGASYSVRFRNGKINYFNSGTGYDIAAFCDDFNNGKFRKEGRNGTANKCGVLGHTVHK